MMYNYPFFSFPHLRKYPNYYSTQHTNTNYESEVPKANIYLQDRYYSQKRNLYNNKYMQENIYNKKSKEQSKKGSSKKMPSGFSFLNNFLHQEDRDDDEKYFDLFGIKLYNDDLLLLGLIFFLYKEDVKDQYLFFALILLLLS